MSETKQQPCIRRVSTIPVNAPGDADPPFVLVKKHPQGFLSWLLNKPDTPDTDDELWVYQHGWVQISGGGV